MRFKIKLNSSDLTGTLVIKDQLLTLQTQIMAFNMQIDVNTEVQEQAITSTMNMKWKVETHLSKISKAILGLLLLTVLKW